MSVAATSYVWKHSPAKGNDRLLLLAIADCADDEGRNAWPSIKTLAEKMGGVDERTVQRGVRRLSKAGLVVVEKAAGRGGTNRYRLVMDGSEASGEVEEPGDNQPSAPADCHPRQSAAPGTGATTPPALLRHPNVLERTTPQPPAERGATGCAAHTAGPGPNCRACGTSSRAAARAAATAKAAAARAARKPCPRHRGQIAGSCGPCRSESLEAPGGDP